MNTVLDILKSEIYNPVLMNNDSIARYWMDTYSFVEMVKDEISTSPDGFALFDGKSYSEGKVVEEQILKVDFKIGIEKIASLTVVCFLYIRKNSSEYKRLLR